MSAIELIDGEYPKELRVLIPELCSYCQGDGTIFSIPEQETFECTACEGTGEVQEISE